MKSRTRILTSLIAVNVIGLIALAFLSLSPSQVTGQNIVRNDRFAASVGRIQAKRLNDVIYVTDRNTNRMVVVEYDDSRGELSVLGGRDMNKDLKDLTRSRTRR